MAIYRKLFVAIIFAIFQAASVLPAEDHLRERQATAFDVGQASWGHWGPRPELYNSWKSHTNRLIPVYTFGANLQRYRDANSVYRKPQELLRLYGRVPGSTVNPTADYFDQTQLHDLQKRAVEAGKKYIFLVIFDGMDWHTTRTAAAYRSGKASYQRGRGSGLSFQDYRGAPTDFGFMVTAPHNSGTLPDPDAQTIASAGGTKSGGYHPVLGGPTPWSRPLQAEYLTGSHPIWSHPYTDSAAAATSMVSGIKTYNAGINTTAYGSYVIPLPRQLQAEHQFAVGAVTSVPISHATPACAYANNVTRKDYQDISRDMLGLPSIAHPAGPLPGLDVLIGAGWGDNLATDPGQGLNFRPGNRYITDADLQKIRDRYEVVLRTPGQPGSRLLEEAARRATEANRPLFGFFGTKWSHLPFQTADGGFNPVASIKELEVYTPADIQENPTLADMTSAAIKVLEGRGRGFWLMVEAGDVDWANHDNNVDNSVGAVLSGVAAFDRITRWIEARKAWDDSMVIVAADHGHLFFLRNPALMIDQEHLSSTVPKNSPRKPEP